LISAISFQSFLTLLFQESSFDTVLRQSIYAPQCQHFTDANLVLEIIYDGGKC